MKSQENQRRYNGSRPFALRLIAGLVLSLLFVGCEGKRDEPAKSELPFSGQQIRVLVPSGWQMKDRWDVQIQEWNARTQATAELIESDMSVVNQSILPEKNWPNLVLLPWTRRGELVANEELLPIPVESLADHQLDWQDLLLGVREKLGETDLGPTFVPLSAPVLACYYRADLLEKAGLKPPETWEEYQVLLEGLSNWAPGLVAVEPWSEEFRATLFLARSLAYVQHPGQYSTFFDVTTGLPLISSPGFVKGLEISRTAFSKLAPESLSSSPEVCRAMLLSGKAAVTLSLETGHENYAFNLGAKAPVESVPSIKRAAGISIGFCRLPGSRNVYNGTQKKWETLPKDQINFATLTGYAGLCAALTSGTTREQAKAAMSLLATLLFEASSVPPAGPRFVVRESQVPEVGTYAGSELAPGEAGRYLGTIARCLRERQLVSEIPVIGHSQFRDALTRNVTAAIQGGKSEAEALKEVELEWIKMIDGRGKSVIQNSYRDILGLGRKEELRSLDEE